VKHRLSSIATALKPVLWLAATTCLLLALAPPATPAAAQYSWLDASQNPVPPGGTSVLTASVYDPDGDPVTVSWTTTAGTLTPTAGLQVTLQVPYDSPGTITVTATADDGQGGVASASMTLLIVASNVAPFISINAEPLVVRRGRTTVLTAATSDPNGDPVTVFWFTTGGTLSSPTGQQVIFTVPDEGEAVDVLAVADDGHGGQAGASLTLLLLPKNLPPVIRVNADPFVVRSSFVVPN
jgi:hypothetical protein